MISKIDELVEKLNVEDFEIKADLKEYIQTAVEELACYQEELIAQENELFAKNEELRQNTEMLLALFHNSSVAYLITDLKFNILDFNVTAKNKLNIGEIKSVHEIIDIDYLNDFYSYITNEELFDEYLTLRLKIDGKGIFYKFKVKKIYIKEERYLLEFLDIDKETTLNLELEKSLKQLETAKKIAKLGAWEYDLKNNILSWSDEIFDMFKLDKNSFTPSFDAFQDLIHEDDRKIVSDAYFKSLEDGVPYKIKHRLVLKNGEVRWVVEKCNTTFDNKGNPLISTGIVQDVTIEEINKEQEKIIMSQSKSASIGNMVGNIAHQWRQPLAVINTSMMKLNAKSKLGMLENKDIYEVSEKIKDQTQYLSQNIETFLNYFKMDKKKQNQILEEHINNAMKICKAILDDNDIKLIHNINKDKNSIVCLPTGELIEVLINIINNAKDALIEKNIENRWIKITLNDLEKSYEITIEDNAGGIPENIIENIFNPYFTTKEKNGTGLGLNMSKDIVEKV